MYSEEDFKNLIDRLGIDDKPNASHRDNLRAQMLKMFNATRQKEPQVSILVKIKRIACTPTL